MDGLLIASASNTEVATARSVRGINGVALVFGAVGNSSAGPTRFEAGSIRLPEDLSRVKLLLDHDATDPLGYLTEAIVDDEKLSVSFTVSEGDRGDMALAQAADKRRDGLSVGCQIEDWHRDGDTIVVTKASLFEVSLVSIPAFADARITEVRANRKDDILSVQDFTVEASVNASNDGVGVEATQVPETVATVTAAAPVAAAAPIYAAPRKADMNLTSLAAFAKTHLQASGAAGFNSAITAALTDVTPVGHPNLGPNKPTYVGELWEASSTARPLIELIGTSNLTSLKLQGFRWADTPEVEKYAGNKAAVPSGPVTRAPFEKSAQRFAGGWDIDRAFIDLPGGEDFITEVFRKAVDDYRMKSEAYVVEQLLAEGTGITSGGSVTAILTDLGVRFAGLGGNLNFIQMSTDYWTEFVNLGAANVPFWLQNQGTIDLGTVGGNAGGLSFRANPNLPAGTIVAGDRRAVKIAEVDPPVRVQALDVANGGIDLGVFGYIAAMVTDPRAVVVVTDSTP